MPRTYETTVYTYAELDDKAKARARDWWREMEARSGDTFFAESITEDFKEVLAACGFDLSSKHGRDALYWSGFSSQGDGACFSASWSASRVDTAALAADRPASYVDKDGVTRECEGNKDLHPILEAATELAASEPTGYGSTEGNDRYMSQRDTTYGHENDDAPGALIDDNTATLEALCRDLAHYFYRSLEREYEYLMSDEAVAESIIANDYEFTIAGERA